MARGSLERFGTASEDRLGTPVSDDPFQIKSVFVVQSRSHSIGDSINRSRIELGALRGCGGRVATFLAELRRLCDQDVAIWMWWRRQ